MAVRRMNGQRAIVMAGGADEKWTAQGGAGRRHFALIGGETLIERTVRQLRERDIDDVVIVAPADERYEVAGASRVDPAIRDWGHEAYNTLGAAGWSGDGRTILVYGDTVFTDQAMDMVAGFAPRAWQLFGRFGASALKRYGEIFAISFWPEHQTAWRHALDAAFALKAQGVIRRAGSWEGFRVLGGALGPDVAAHRPYPALMTEIDDLTDDFDTPEELDRLLAGWAAAGLLEAVRA